jgi:hypothetical protein
MKTSKIFVLAAVAISMTTPVAYASSGLIQQRIARENYEYFKAKGVVGSGQPIAQNPDYQFASTPEKRLAKRNFDYFQQIGYKGGEVTHFNRYTDVSEYPFTGSVLSAERGGYVWSSAVKH